MCSPSCFRLASAEDSLEECRREMIELTEAKASLERERNALRLQAADGLDDAAIAG